jgi:hypothetical protein
MLWRRLGTLGVLLLMFGPVAAGLYLARLCERWNANRKQNDKV